MTHVITQSCCADASCVIACPVNCIHPTPGEPGFAQAEQLYVDPNACVDCGACVTACPVDAIKPHTTLTTPELPFLELNRLYFEENPHADRTPLMRIPRRRRLPTHDVRVAVVGAGPAGLFAADELLRHPGITVHVYDKLPTPYGLVRAGVAPDHQLTKKVTQYFMAIEEQAGFDYRLGVKVGVDISLEQLRELYHAVIYAGGAPADRRLGIPGEELPGSFAATQLVGWYNGHPAHQRLAPNVDTDRMVVVGNGNVALDIARIFTMDVSELEASDITATALNALRGSRIQEVVVLGRRGPDQAALTMPELVGLANRDDVNLVVDPGGAEFAAGTPKSRLLQELSQRVRQPGLPTIILRFCVAPLRLLGQGQVTGIEVEHTRLQHDSDGNTVAVATGVRETIATSLVVRSIGHRAHPVPGLPFDERTATVPNLNGRVEPGMYVAGWIKRGPTGHIGTNKHEAVATVEALLDDLASDLLPTPAVSLAQADQLVRQSAPGVIDLAGWRTLDNHERSEGARLGKRRDKVTQVEQMRHIAAQPPARAARRGLFAWLG